MPERLNDEVMKELVAYGHNLLEFMVDNTPLTADNVLTLVDLAHTMDVASSNLAFVPYEGAVDGD